MIQYNVFIKCIMQSIFSFVMLYCSTIDVGRYNALNCTLRFRFRTEIPDTSDFDFLVQDWSNSPYADTREEFPKNLPLARGKPVLMTTFVDANLMHDVLSGKSVTGVLHCFNKTPIDWYSKKQNTVETATYGLKTMQQEPPSSRSKLTSFSSITQRAQWMVCLVSRGSVGIQHGNGATLLPTKGEAAPSLLGISCRNSTSLPVC